MSNACAPKGSLSTSQRKRLPAHAFAIPSIRMFPLYKRGPGGTLLPSRTHAINAKGRAQQAYNRGDLSASTLRRIDREADRVIQECKKMAKAKSSKKRAKKRPAKSKPKRKVALTKTGRTYDSKKPLAKREITMLRSIDRQAKRGRPVTTKNYSSDSAKALLRSLSARRFIQSIAPGKGYMLTPKGAKAVGNKYATKSDLKVVTKSSGGKVPSTKKKATKKKARKKKRTPAQIAATKKLVEMNKRKAKKTSKKKATKKKAKPRAQTRARYQAKKGQKRGRLRTRIAGNKNRVPVEVYDDPKVQNKVLILV